MIPIWLQLKLEMEISKLKKDLKEKDNVIEEKEEEMYLLNEKLEQQQVNNPHPSPTPIPPPQPIMPPLFITSSPYTIMCRYLKEEKEKEMYLLNEKLEQLKVPPIIPQQSIIKDSINYLPPVFLKLNEENNLTAPPSTLQSESAHLLSIIFFLNYGISLSLNNLLSCYNNALSLTYSEWAYYVRHKDKKCLVSNVLLQLNLHQSPVNCKSMYDIVKTDLYVMIETFLLSW